MTTAPVPWVTPTRTDAPPEPRPKTPDEFHADYLVESLRDRIEFGAHTSPRSLQVTIGASEIGGECPRQIAYRVAGTPAVNFPDPLRPLAGIGGHVALADVFRRVDGGMGRYLIEEKLEYRSVPGTVDLYDRVRTLVIDWKWAPKAKVREVKRNGPPKKYIVQAMIYGAALEERGDPVSRIAIVYLPLNGDLTDLWAWTAPFDRAMADQAIDEFLEVRAMAIADGPDTVKPNPTRLCPWCAHYLPTSTDTRRACPDGYRKEDS